MSGGSEEALPENEIFYRRPSPVTACAKRPDRQAESFAGDLV
jgi:hypothetical protein